MFIKVNLTVLIILGSVLLFFIAATFYFYVKHGVTEKKMLKEIETLKAGFSNEFKLLRKKALDSELTLDDMIKKYNNQMAVLKNRLAEADKAAEQASAARKNTVSRENSAVKENTVVREQNSVIKNQHSLIVEFKDMVTEMIRRFHTVAELNNHLTNRHKAKAEKSEAIKSIVTDFQTGNRELEVLIDVLEQEVLSLDGKLKGQVSKSEMKG
ncbi:MAG: hypothetical protein H7844_03760 [Nitrospirae bacterium YQR-1]